MEGSFRVLRIGLILALLACSGAQVGPDFRRNFDMIAMSAERRDADVPERSEGVV